MKTIPISRLLVLAVMSAVILAACDGGASENSDVQMTLIPAPEGVNGRYLTVQLRNADGQPITDATVGVEGNMSHAGMAPVQAEGVADDADEATDGRYQLPFEFTMLGDWVITVDAELADGESVGRDFQLAVDGENVTITGEN